MKILFIFFQFSLFSFSFSLTEDIESVVEYYHNDEKMFLDIQKAPI